MKETTLEEVEVSHHLPRGCPNHPLHLLILVLSAPNSEVRRRAIRGTWLHNYSGREIKVTAKFLVGMVHLDDKRRASLEEEESQYGDIVFLETLKDSYSNLSSKVLLGFKWAYETVREFDYLIKVDDDSYMRIKEIANVIRGELKCDKFLYWGYFMGHAFPVPTGKWAEKNWFNCPHYFPYAMGGGYALSRGAVEILMQFPNRLTLYNNEDITVSSWLVPYRLNRLHDIRFNAESRSRGCMNWYLLSHKEKVRSYYTKYGNLIKTGELCTLEKELQPAYIYNWTRSPLNCCDRIKGLGINRTIVSYVSSSNIHL